MCNKTCIFLCPILTWPSLIPCRFRCSKSYNTFKALSKSNLLPTTYPPELTGEHLANLMLGWLEIILQFHLKYSWLNSFSKITWSFPNSIYTVINTQPKCTCATPNLHSLWNACICGDDLLRTNAGMADSILDNEIIWNLHSCKLPKGLFGMGIR